MASIHPSTDRVLPPTRRKSPLPIFLSGLFVGMIVLALISEFVQDGDALTEFFRPPVRPYAAYVAALESSGLAESVMASAWIDAGNRALADSNQLSPPHMESGYISPPEPHVISYRIIPRQGQHLSVRMELSSVVDSPLIFIELFEGIPVENQKAQLVAYADSGSYQLQYEVEADQPYLLRIQPELMARFSYRLFVQLDASLAFPVQGKDSRAVRSFWGDARDGGKRKHKGIDIFAARGTPVLAAKDGRITRVKNGGLGGKVVWQRGDKQRYSLYYAHLDTQWVQRGQLVRAGDTLGLVGNTGNARTTPPHLHFGIYRRGRGAVDPFPFVDQPAILPPALVAADTGLLAWYRTRRPARLLAAPFAKADKLAELLPQTPVKRLSASGSWHRVELTDGTKGFVRHTDTHSIHTPLKRIRLSTKQFLLDQIREGIISDSLQAGSELEVLAQTASHTYVRTGTGRLGYLINHQNPSGQDI